MRLFVTAFCLWAFASGAVSAESTPHEPNDEPAAKDFGIEARIVGGQPASEDEYPFFTRWSGCGASLVWKDFLLTAAHVSGKSRNPE
jgi:secreted trypsin-like serine protease